ncbi:MAG TPA: STAS domain-containing protein [Piscinibacter sp.]|nr:STAS domain-containing protein [Piscinibacter sp.]
MSDSKEPTSFFRKVVKFVANPTTEWAEIGTPTEEARETEYAKSELKAMVERKRRNDFVRKREFDMLRKVRREGLTSEQLAALGGSSRLDDSEAKMAESGAKQESGVKAKIDEIEQQMVGDGGFSGSQRRTPEFYNAPTQPVPMSPPAAPALPQLPVLDAQVDDFFVTPERTASPTPARAGAQPLKLDSRAAELVSPFAVEVSEVAHDPELDEAVIAFANADFEQCEHAITAMTGQGAPRAEHAETWLVLFDLYRAIGQQHKFESLALDYAQQFGWSAPQWFSMPRMVAEAASEDRPARNSRIEGNVGWVCPDYLDADAVARLSSQSLQMPLPWVFDWSALKNMDAEAAAKLSELFRNWIRQKLDMRWLGGERLFAVLAEAAPTGVRDADPAYWQLRLDALRMTNRPDQFDEAAIDYCVTYEVSPPSWEPAQCEVRVSGSQSSTTSPPLSMVSDVSTSFIESRFNEDPTATVQVASVELSGQLVGDIGPTLKRLEAELGGSTIVNVSCSRLIRVDFIAAGDLLNWVLARRNENRSVVFVESHRLVALFFGAMGINEHARVKVRSV